MWIFPHALFLQNPLDCSGAEGRKNVQSMESGGRQDEYFRKLGHGRYKKVFSTDRDLGQAQTWFLPQPVPALLFPGRTRASPVPRTYPSGLLILQRRFWPLSCHPSNMQVQQQVRLAPWEEDGPWGLGVGDFSQLGPWDCILSSAVCTSEWKPTSCPWLTLHQEGWAGLWILGPHTENYRFRMTIRVRDFPSSFQIQRLWHGEGQRLTQITQCCDSFIPISI